MKTHVMNKSIVSLCLLIIITSCLDKNKKKVFFHPNEKTFLNKKKLSLIEYNNLSFQDISRLIDAKRYHDSLTYVNIIDSDHNKHNIVIDNTSFHAKRRSLLSVGHDSIFIDKGYKIDRLKSLMKRHYENNGKNPLYPLNSKTAFIEIALKENSKDFRTTLLKVIKTFDSVNKIISDTLELKILLKRIKPPPPPPPPDDQN